MKGSTRLFTLATCSLFSAMGSLIAAPAFAATSIYGAVSSSAFSDNIQQAATTTTTSTPTDSDNIPRVFNWAEAAFGQYFAPRWADRFSMLGHSRISLFRPSAGF